MNKNILIITDYKTHEKIEDFYPISKQLKKNADNVYILDRAVKKNNLFFTGTVSSKLYLHKIITSDFSFDYYTQYYNKVNTFENIIFDIILLRIDRPISDYFLKFVKNYFLSGLLINEPDGIIKTASKEFLFQFSDLIAPSKLCFSYEDIIKFSNNFSIVIKPLKGYGGSGIFKIFEDSYYFENTKISKEKFKEKIVLLLNKEKKCIATKYLKNVLLGDKRIYVVNGTIIGAFNRVPKHNSWLANTSQGASTEKTIITIEERKIIEKINKKLSNIGIYIYGVDILIGDKNEPLLSEINTLNAGGCYQIDILYNKNTTETLIESLYTIRYNKTE